MLLIHFIPCRLDPGVDWHGPLYIPSSTRHVLVAIYIRGTILIFLQGYRGTVDIPFYPFSLYVYVSENKRIDVISCLDVLSRTKPVLFDRISVFADKTSRDADKCSELSVIALRNQKKRVLSCIHHQFGPYNESSSVSCEPLTILIA